MPGYGVGAPRVFAQSRSQSRSLLSLSLSLLSDLLSLLDLRLSYSDSDLLRFFLLLSLLFYTYLSFFDYTRAELVRIEAGHYFKGFVVEFFVVIL